MFSSETRSIKRILAGMNYCGIDRIYQQLGSELGLILTLHHVNPDPVPEFAPNAHLTVHPAFLEAAVKLLASRGFDFVSLDEAVERIENGTSNHNRFAAFTFDDGYKDTLDHAVPVLRKYDVPYTIYLAPALNESTALLWWENIESLIRSQDGFVLNVPGSRSGPREVRCATLHEKYEAYAYLLDYLTQQVPEDEQDGVVRELCWLYKIDCDASTRKQIIDWPQTHSMLKDPNCTFGAHSLSHRALARLSRQRAHEEIVSGVEVMTAELGEKPRHFAYPYGYEEAASDREFELTRELGFKTAVTTRPGMIFPAHKHHLTALPRISINGLFQHMRYFSPLTTGLPTLMRNRFKQVSFG